MRLCYTFIYGNALLHFFVCLQKAEFFAKRKDLGLKYPISGYAMFIADFASKNHGKYPCATDIIREGNERSTK